LRVVIYINASVKKLNLAAIKFELINNLVTDAENSYLQPGEVEEGAVHVKANVDCMLIRYYCSLTSLSMAMHLSILIRVYSRSFAFSFYFLNQPMTVHGRKLA